jgi:excisionase family DNA binding protein
MKPEIVPPKSPTVPRLLTTPEVAELLRTSTKAIYAMIERLQLPGVVRIGRRILVREEVLLNWLGQKTPTLSSES